MSSPSQTGFGANAGKKAVHVKWAGKTIALGTFPAAEADEKCARAKALTRAWRSTMRPKPTRDWVMTELERLGVRVVSGRLGRKADGEEDGPGEGVGGKKISMGVMDRSGSMGLGYSDADLNSLMMARRNSSLGLSMMNDRRGSLGSLGQAVGLEVDPTMPPHRPLVGGGAAAAYEAARHDHFTQKEQQRRASSLGLGSLGGGFGSMGGMSVNPNQHYEMLKLHHMNLLNEIQETTLMMNLYQQQQLQQQQQQLQQQASDPMVGASDMAMLLQQSVNNPSLDVFGSQLSQQRASLGLGSPAGGFTTQQQMQMLQQQAMQVGHVGLHQETGQGGEQPGLEGRIAQLKQDIAKGESGEAAASGTKRSVEEEAAASEEQKHKQVGHADDDEDYDSDDDDDDDKDESHEI